MKSSFDRTKLEISLVESRRDSWDMANRKVSGVVYSYRVLDRNFRVRNGWSFLIRVPGTRDKSSGIQVQPEGESPRESWKELLRRSIIFIPAENGVHVGKVYCKVSLQDTTGRRTKVTGRRGERDDFPDWMQPLRRFMRLKSTVKDTRGTDANAQCLVLSEKDHERMIWAFFAMKVWVKAGGFELAR